MLSADQKRTRQHPNVKTVHLHLTERELGLQELISRLFQTYFACCPR